jgi:hypothetical protein
MSIFWIASDKNLAAKPITLRWSAQPDSPGEVIVAGLDNTGRYDWAIPRAGVPYVFYIRVEAADKAGNVGPAVSDLVKVDLAKPKTMILDVGSPER